MLKVCNLVVQRSEINIFKNISFNVGAGECLQIVGSNGSGKTTLLKVIAGLITPSSGIIENTATQLYCGHNICLHLDLSPMQNLLFLLSLQFKPQSNSIKQALTQVYLLPYLNSPCYELSAGQLQRVLLAYLFLSKAALWLLDEPSCNLDHNGLQLLNQVCSQHLQKRGAIVIATHQDMHFKTATLNMDQNA